MSLLTICQNVANDIPVAVPSVIVGSTNETARLLLSSAKKAGEALYREYNWLELVTEYTFSTAADTVDYDLPSDFGRVVNQTLWDRTNYTKMRGALTPQQWQEYKSSVLATSAAIWKRYRIRNVSGTTKFSIYPTPTAVESLVFEYVSKNWCQSSGGTGQTTWASDSDTGILDEYLIELGTRWRVLSRLGMAYAEERDEYDREVSRAKARNGGAPILALNHRHSAHFLNVSNIPETGFGS